MTIAKIFKSGRSQAVRLPKEFRFKGREVYIEWVGNKVMLIPKLRGWKNLEASLGEFTEDFMADRDQPKKVVKRQPL